jgi:hypothetical protein
MKIGEKVSVHPQTFGKGAMEGKVVYLHPENRYAVVEFEITPAGPKWGEKPKKIRLRECFQLRRSEK